MAIFLTGSTGYIGGYIAARLLERHPDRVNVLVRARDADDASERLWRSLQLHLGAQAFHEALGSRFQIFLGDLTSPHFGLDDTNYRRLAETTDSVIHCAASLNRKSEKSCLNVNLRGTLEVIQLARRTRQTRGLRRFSQVSTVAVAGHRNREVVQEDTSIDWERSDYDPYARTKKFCEHMVRELLPDVPRTVFRPSIVLGDSGRPETTQFDMVRAFVFLARLPILPFRPDDRIDIVPVDYVADAVVAIHQKERPEHEIYHLSSGTGSETFRQITDALSRAGGKLPPLFWEGLDSTFEGVISRLSRGRGRFGRGASLLKVFWPYLVWDTVFDNTRVVEEMGRTPAPFSSYCHGLLQFSVENHFSYPYRAWPAAAGWAAEMPLVRGGHAS